MKKVNWKQIVEDLLEGLFLSQHDLAERCGVSQQSISNWKNGLRTPSNFVKKRIVEILDEEKIALTDYQVDEDELFLVKHMGRMDVRELLDSYDGLPDDQRREILDLARSKAQAHEKATSQALHAAACLKCHHHRGKKDKEHSHQDLAHGDIPPAPVQQ